MHDPGKIKIFIVEDSPTQAARLEYDLVQAGYVVKAFGDGDAAFEAAQTDVPDLIITDVFMPGIGGYELCRQLKDSAVTAAVPVMLLTALSDPADVIRGLECGADSFVVKPYDAPNLVDRIGYILDNRDHRPTDPVLEPLPIVFGSASYRIESNRTQILNLLLSSYETAIHERRAVDAAHERLQDINVELAQGLKDRTEALREAEAARREAEIANSAKSDFLASMSHELRTPLNAIIGFSELLEEDCEANGHDEYLADLRKIRAAGGHLLTLINDILDLSKIEAGKVEIERGEIDIADLMQDLAGVAGPLMTRNENRLLLEGMDSAGDLESDITRVRQILLNLLSNAAKFTKGGEVRFSVRPRRESGVEWVEFEVADTGIGMNEQQLRRVFDPFTQADGSTARRFGGTGLGLTLCRRLCGLLGGEIGVSSREDEGSTFTVRLPRTMTAGVPPEVGPVVAPERRPIGSGGGRRVLVIDDDDDARELLAQQLQRSGWEVVEADSGRRGLEIARSSSPQVILLDVMMPEVDGWSVLQMLKADPEIEHIPVVLCTLTDDRRRGFALGASDYLLKPLERNKLVAALERFGAVPGSRGLVVEDDQASRNLMIRATQRLGWKVRSAANGREALAVLEEAPADLILLDLMMPEMDGFEFVETVKRRGDWCDIPIIVITAKTLTPEERQRLSGNVLRVFGKPEHSGVSLDRVLSDALDVVAPRAPSRGDAGDNPAAT